MATGSFKHNIIIKDKKTAEKLITALEKASKMGEKLKAKGKRG